MVATLDNTGHATEPVLRPKPVHRLLVYEQPLNERMRTLLRLEFLLEAGMYHARGRSTCDSRAAIGYLLDLLATFSRIDVKSEMLKELDRLSVSLHTLQSNPQVDSGKLSDIVGKLEAISSRLHGIQGQIANALRTNEFLGSIRQRSVVSGASCSFDLPAYHHWLQRPAAERTEQLERWFEEFEVAHNAIRLILDLTREGATSTQETARAGFFQDALPPNMTCQMVRVGIARGLPYVAEISGSRHRFTVRFTEATLEGRSAQTKRDVEFELARCLL